MFRHIFINRLKCIIRDKVLIFWTLVFSLILATLFGMAFTNISSSENFSSIDVAVINNDAYQKNEDFRKFLKAVSEGEGKLFNIIAATKDEAEKLLDDNKIAGYIIGGPQTELVVKKSGFKQSIIKSALDGYSQTVTTLTAIIKNNPAALQNGLLEDAGGTWEYTEAVPLGTTDKPDTTVNYFYSLIAMACFYGAFIGMKEITDTQANLSKRAARLNVAPVHKLKVLTAGLLAGYVILVMEILILLAYLIFVIKVDFGKQTGYILMTCFMGCAAGITFGAFIGAAVKKGEGVKTAVLIGSTMAASFLAGMMSGGSSNIKYLVAKDIPVLAYINPITLITDALYALYYYDTHTRFFININLLSGFTILFCLLTYLIIRRRRYASI
ncbi:ABC-2 type transport system permease protein [Ruminiclostridium sufflavum DSM 19573]|uniref:ABC-2 type transport system permease protein n=1 Tax=Ruminiclostridium sufflavum DSM 19573 TaxID=1121337 RepID=A0A318XGV6_9FIRM|nr:ABC transporter permease [Ruminiclostridium sufflavum]PYG85770.1 ABC-2 type transport system permease protein [Ruminiclostridium sufflavum DSM 19573]